MQTSKIVRLPLPARRFLTSLMLLSSLTLFASLWAHQNQVQRCEAIKAKQEAIKAASASLTHDIAVTTQQLKALAKSRKYTEADIKRFEVTNAAFRTRSARIKADPRALRVEFLALS